MKISRGSYALITVAACMLIVVCVATTADAGEWIKIGGPAKGVFVGAKGLYMRDAKTDCIYRYEGCPMNWKQIGGPGIMWAVNNIGVYGISPDDKSVWQYTGTGTNWIQIGVRATKELIAGGNALYRIDLETDTIYRYEGTPKKWAPVGGPGMRFAANDDSLFGISPDGDSVRRYTGTGKIWEKIATGPADLLIVRDKVAYVRKPDGVYHYEGKPMQLPKVGPWGYAFALSKDALYRLAGDLKSVWQRTRTGANWNQIATTPPGEAKISYIWARGKTLYAATPGKTEFTYGAIWQYQPSLFTLVDSVQVTPAGKFLRGSFVRIFYVRKSDRIIVTFNTDQSKSAAGVYHDSAYAYREYTTDMVATGKGDTISTHATNDTGALLVEDDFYLASQEAQDGYEGWYLAKYDVVNKWKKLVGKFYKLRKVDPSNYLGKGKDPGDPMLGYMNGQIDISSKYISDTTTIITPTKPAATHHQFFKTDDLTWVREQILSDTPHMNMTSMVTLHDTVHFLAGTALKGKLIVMRYKAKKAWNYIDTKLLKEDSSCPEGAAFDGTRFYVSYLDKSNNNPSQSGGFDNVRLAAFDSDWIPLEDIAVTNFTKDDGRATARPSLALHHCRLYVCYDQAPTSDSDIKSANVQAYVKVYDVTHK